jgi:hypothetical protein
MAPRSQIRLRADQLFIGLSDTDAGALVFERGTVGGVQGLTLRSAVIGDLTVDTLQIVDAA